MTEITWKTVENCIALCELKWIEIKIWCQTGRPGDSPEEAQGREALRLHRVS